MKIAIIGGGLAGTACAYVLKQAGLEPVIYEASSELASAASGNEMGLYNPRFTAELSPEGQYYAQAFRSALQVFKSLCHPEQSEGSRDSSAMPQNDSGGNDIEWNACGALHLITDEKKERRFTKMIESWGWGEGDMRILSSEQASEIAGIDVPCAALYLPKAGYLSPRQLCAAYAKDVEVCLNHKIQDISEIEADAVIFAGGQGLLNFPQISHIPLKSVRGQVSKVKATERSSAIRCNIQYGGYLSPAHADGWHMLGSTFQRWLDHSDVIAQDNQENLDKLSEHFLDLARDFEVMEARAAVRITTPDNFPVVGRLDDDGTRPLYISAAHGSHGIVSTIMAAQHLAALILGQNSSLSQGVVERLSPLRYDRQTSK